MIIDKAIDDEFAFTLSDTGVITQYKLTTDLVEHVIEPPPTSQAVQIMTRNKVLYARMDDGAVFSRWEHQGVWDPVEIPGPPTWLASHDDGISMLFNNEVYQAHERVRVWEPIIGSPAPPGLTQIDQDEDYTFAVHSSGALYWRKIVGGDWELYPEQIEDVQRVVVGALYVYVSDIDGKVYRSKTEGFSGWEVLSGVAVDNGVIAIPSNHIDHLWFCVGGEIGFVTPEAWVSERIYWVIEGWADTDWVVTEPI